MIEGGTATKDATATVLVVEDEPVTRARLVGHLSGRGFRTAEAEAIGPAELALKAVRPDVVLLDINLPGKSGYELIRRLRVRAGSFS